MLQEQQQQNTQTNMAIQIVNQYHGNNPNLLQALKEQGTKLVKLLELEEKKITLVLINDEEMQEFNLNYRGKDQSTNVLAFPVSEDDIKIHPDMERELGDILISVDTAEKEAAKENISLEHRVTRLLIHGLLHLMGWDHEQGEKEALEMWDYEEKLFDELLNNKKEI